MSPPTESFDAFLEKLREVYVNVRAVSEQMLADIECSGAERSLLLDLDRMGPQTVPALAHERAVTRQAMQRTIDRMHERGWVAAMANPRHQSSRLFVIAPAGRKVLTAVRTRERQLLTQSPLPISDTELTRTTAVLGELAAHFEHLTLRSRLAK